MPEIYGNDADGQNRRAIEAYNRILAGRNPYGALGQVGQDYLDPDQWRALPDWLRNQYYQANDDSGLARYRLMSGLLNDPDGNEFVQIGDLSSAVGEGDNSVIDWEQVSYDPRLGMRTTGGNRRSVQSDAFRNGRLATLAAIVAATGYGALAEGGMVGGATNPFAGSVASGSIEGLSPFTGSVASGSLTGGIDPTLLEPATGALPSGPATPLTGAPPISGPSPTGFSRLADVLTNPGNAARIIGAVGSGIQGNRGSSRSDSSGGIDPNDPMSIINAMANVNRVNHTTPFGSRQWAQDQSGRWSVTDSLSPEEQANYEGVRGMNANVTDLAMQRLAQVMAGGGRQRADRPIMFAGRRVGG